MVKIKQILMLSRSCYQTTKFVACGKFVHNYGLLTVVALRTRRWDPLEAGLGATRDVVRCTSCSHSPIARVMSFCKPPVLAG